MPSSLHRRHALARGRNFAGNFDRRAVRRFHVYVDERLEKDVVAPMLVEQRRIRSLRQQHVVDRGQFLELDLDGSGNVFRFGPRVGDTHCNQFADLTHLLECEDRLFGNLKSRQAGNRTDRLHALKIGCDENAIAEPRRNPNVLDARMGKRAANERYIAHPGEANVRDELSAPAHQAVIFLAQEPRAHTLLRHAHFLESPMTAASPNSSYF